jgi:predicted phage-related endonuclease
MSNEEIENIETMIALPEEEAFLIINEYNLACTAIKDAEKRKEVAKEELIGLMGKSQIGICADIKVTYKPSCKITLDAKMIEQYHPEIYKQYSKQSDFFTLRIGKIK